MSDNNDTVKEILSNGIKALGGEGLIDEKSYCRCDCIELMPCGDASLGCIVAKTYRCVKCDIVVFLPVFREDAICWKCGGAAK